MKTTYGLPKKREELIQELQDAFTNQNLDETEYENRLREALHASSMEELEVIVSDFPAEIRQRLFPTQLAVPVGGLPGAPASQLPAMPMTDTRRALLGEDKCQVALLGGQTQSFLSIMGSQVADFRQSQIEGQVIKINAECLLGETKLDLRNENLAGKDIHIWVGGGLGAIKVLVPPGGTIQNQAQLFGGSFKIKDKRKNWINRLTGNTGQEVPPLAFTLTIHGTYWLGEIEVAY
jgi:hypothetical protein